MTATVIQFPAPRPPAHQSSSAMDALVALINETRDLWMADVAARAKLAKAAEPQHAEYCKGPWPCDCQEVGQ